MINRGNYRSWIFETEGARHSFLKCLNEACLAMGWRLHACVLMSNHYYLCVETPSPNLVEGMRWLQSTFANRFNRFRQMNGHVLFANPPLGHPAYLTQLGWATPSPRFRASSKGVTRRFYWMMEHWGLFAITFTSIR